MNEIVRLVEKYMSPFRYAAGEIRVANCPFCNGGESHDEYTFSVNLQTGAYCCFRGNCGAKGGFRKLAAHFGESTLSSFKLNSSSGISYLRPKSSPMPLTQQIIDYFENRCIGKKTLDDFAIGADENGNILFPFFVNGDLIFVKHRMLNRASKKDPKETQDRGTRPVLFGMDLCKQGEPLIIVEGQIDALSLYEIGIRNVVSVPCGCENLKWIEECWDWLEQFEEIVIFGDNDAPGRKMVSQLIMRLGEDRCKIVEEYPIKPDGTECKDANDILCAIGDMALLNALYDAKDVPLRGLIDLASIVPVDPTTIPRIKTNIPALDATLGGLREGAVTVFTGAPGAGKSTLTGLLMLNAIEQGHSVCAYSGELTATEFQQWINLQAAGSDYITIKYDPVREGNVPVIPQNIEKEIMDWYKGKFFLYDNQEIFETNQSESVLQVFTMAAKRYGCKLFLADNLMTVTSDSEEETRAQGHFMNALKRFANRFSVHVIIVAHPRKIKAGEKIRQDDIGGNSATIRLAHNAVVVEKPNLRIIKARDSGILKLVECCYCPDSRRIYQKDKGDLNQFGWNTENIPMPAIKACDSPEFGVQLGETDLFI